MHIRSAPSFIYAASRATKPRKLPQFALSSESWVKEGLGLFLWLYGACEGSASTGYSKPFR
jgi:hypothetical protein